MRELRQTVTDLRATMFDLRDSTNSLLFRASQTNLDPLRYSHFDVIRQSSDSLNQSHHFNSSLHLGGSSLQNNHQGTTSFLLHDNVEKHTAATTQKNNSSLLKGSSLTFRHNQTNQLISKDRLQDNDDVNDDDEDHGTSQSVTSKASINATESSTILNATLDDVSSIHQHNGALDGKYERLNQQKQGQGDNDTAPEFVGPAQSDDEFGEVL